jgi:simple sugar transport system ATP-binding protein
VEDLVRLEGIVKVYPPVVAVDHVSVSFRTGEIHAVVGENGAGKSTLMKVLYGLVPRDAGRISLGGEPVSFRGPEEALARGIGMVHQEILLVPEYTVWQNVVLGREPVRSLGRLDEQRARRLVRERIREFQLNLDPDAVVGDISVAARQKVEILKLLFRNVSILILDEPTAVLAPQEVPQLFAELGRLRDNGRTVIFISHRLDEVLALSDRITVMRRGKKIDTVRAGATGKEELARMMVGREVVFSSRRTPRTPGEVVCEIDGLTVRGPDGRRRLEAASLRVRAGEVVGIAGVEGNGQLELVEAIIGLARPQSGSIRVQGRDLTREPILERRRLISFVPQDRGRMGASLGASIMENAIMTHHRLDPRFTRLAGLLLDLPFARRFAQRVREEFSVSMSSERDPFRSLSGGNQQKLILGRELLLDCPFVLLDQPTRGLDVGSIEYVHQQVLGLRERNRAVLLISADLEELFLIADRIVVMHRGELVADLPVEEATVERIGRLMLEGRARAS